MAPRAAVLPNNHVEGTCSRDWLGKLSGHVLGSSSAVYLSIHAVRPTTGRAIHIDTCLCVLTSALNRASSGGRTQSSSFLRSICDTMPKPSKRVRA